MPLFSSWCWALTDDQVSEFRQVSEKSLLFYFPNHLET